MEIYDGTEVHDALENNMHLQGITPENSLHSTPRPLYRLALPRSPRVLLFSLLEVATLDDAVCDVTSDVVAGVKTS